LSEGSLPVEERGRLRRYALLNRFDVNLPPGGSYVLPGPENWRIDKSIEGMYLLLFRVEASDAPNSVSAIGPRSIPTGGVAGFSMPTLRYYVGASSNTAIQQIAGTDIDLITPSLPIVVSWPAAADAKLYRVEIEDDEKNVFTAMVLAPAVQYQVPSFVRELAASKPLKWKVTSLGDAGQVIGVSVSADLK
jgi:hypothetical protein